MKIGKDIKVNGGVVFPQGIKDFLSEKKPQFFVLAVWGKKLPTKDIERAFDMAFQNKGFPAKLYLALTKFISNQRKMEGSGIFIPLPETERERILLFYGILPEDAIEPPEDEELITPEMVRRLAKQICRFLGKNPGFQGAFIMAKLLFEEDKAIIIWEEPLFDMGAFVKQHPAWKRAGKIWGNATRTN